MTKNLFIPYWKCSSNIRDAEVIDSINTNIISNLFDKIYILYDEIKPFVISSNNIIFIEFQNNTLMNLLNIINQHTTDSDINIISNSDIIYDESIELCHNIEDEVYAITRHEFDGKLHNYENSYGTSQDCWIFKGKFKGNLKKYKWKFFGHPGCDGRFAYMLLFDYDFKILNPCKSIKIFHNHDSNIRTGTSQEFNYTNKNIRIPTPHCFIRKKYAYESISIDDFVIYDERFGHFKYNLDTNSIKLIEKYN